jgi:hydrogenase expression/formation protein HypE
MFSTSPHSTHTRNSKTVIWSSPHRSSKLCARILPQGKLPVDVLKTILESARPGLLVVPPEVGVDVGVIKASGKYLVSSSDPITGTTTRMGWHGVNVSANDVATSGIMPSTVNIVSLFPEGTTAEEIRTLMDEINETASSLDITVAGGHTEITPELKRPIVVVTAFGTGDRFVTAADALAGDAIIMSKTAGLEGTSILSRLPSVRRIVGLAVSRSGEKLINQLSVVPEAKAAFATGKVHAMHDVTEGGVLGAVLEMSLASNLGFELRTDVIPIDRTTAQVCSKLRLDPLRLIGSGALLIACRAADEKKIFAALGSKRIPTTKIGQFLPKRKGRWSVSGGIRERVSEESVEDELWGALSKYG